MSDDDDYQSPPIKNLLCLEICRSGTRARLAQLEAALRGLLDAFETNEIDDFTAYAEPIPTAIHAARAALAALAPQEPKP